MSRARFTDKSAAFLRSNYQLLDMVLGHMAMDIEAYIKQDAGTPVDTGTMKSQVRHFRAENGKFRVEANAEYSSVQEAGERNGIKFKHYTTAGTGPHWFQRSINAITKDKENYVHEAARALNL